MIREIRSLNDSDQWLASSKDNPWVLTECITNSIKGKSWTAVNIKESPIAENKVEILFIKVYLL